MSVGSSGDETPQPMRIWRFGHAEFDEARRELRLNGRVCSVEAKPLAILQELLVRQGLVSKETLKVAVWPGVKDVGGSLTTAISKLRTALDDRDWTIIVAVRGEGYQVGVPVSVRPSPEQAGLGFAPRTGEPVPNRPQWRLEQRLGGGASPDVWLARHIKTSERRVFKFADSARQLEALKREVALSRLLRKSLGERPDFVPVNEWNFELRPYFIETPFSGLNLADWAAARGGLATLPIVHRIDLVSRIARTVAAAHDVRVLHGDIKPSNVLIGEEDGRAAVRLADFGSGRMTDLARLHAAQITPAPGLAADGRGPEGALFGAGTLRYLAPEVFDGGAPTISADVYALGVLLYQMVVGDLDRSLAPGWEDGIDDLLLRQDIADAVAGDPARRLRSAASLAERLEGLEARRAAAASQQAERARLARLAARDERARWRQPWIIAASALLVCGLIGTGLATRRALRERDDARHQARIARAVNSFLTEDLLGRGDPARSGRAAETLMQAAAAAEPRIAYRLAAEPIVAASIYRALAQSFEGRSAFAAARAEYDRAVAAFDRAEGANSADAIILRLRRARMEAASAEAGSLDAARALIAAAAPHLAGLGARQAEALVWRDYAQGSIDITLNDVETALREITAAIDRADTLPDVFDDAFRSSLRQKQAYADLRLARWDAADRVLRVLEPHELALYGPHHPDTLLVRYTVAVERLDRGDSSGAARLLEQIYPEMVTVFGPDARETLIALDMRAQAFNTLQRYDEAIRDDMALYRLVVAKQGEHAYLAAAALGDAGQAQCRSGDGSAGLTAETHALDIANATFGAASAMAQLIQQDVALCLVVEKRYPEASALLDRIDQQAASRSSTSDDGAVFNLIRAEIAVADGRLDEARGLLREPQVTFREPAADPYMSQWTTRLVLAATVVRRASSHEQGVVAMSPQQ